jgi:uncharacterized protein
MASTTSTIRIGGRPRRWPAVVVGALVLVAFLFTILAGFFIEILWFREIDQSNVFWTTLRTKALLGSAFGVAFFVLLYANLVIARRITPTTRVLTPDQEVLERLREQIDPYTRWLVPAGAAVLALFVGIGVSGQWETYLLWRGGADLSIGAAEPQFGRDPTFYLFTLPWLRFIQGWLFSSLVGVTLLTALAHALWGGIRPQAPVFADKVAPAVRAHLSVLLGLIFLVKAWGYWIGRFDLLTSRRGVVQGASYTDVNAQLPALNFLAVVAVICAVLFFLNIRVRLWSLPVIAVALLAVVSVLLGTAYPAFVQNFRVRPNEQQFELPFIERNIEGTRAAFGLDAIDLEQRDVGTRITPEGRADNETTIENIRLWRPSVIADNYRSLQRIRQYYEFNDVDVDRYQTPDGPRLLMLSAREIRQSGIPTGGGTWTNERLTYTHGFGMVAAQVNTATAEGQPSFTLRDIPPSGMPEIERPGIYYGERVDVPFVVVNTNTAELDYEGGEEDVQYVGEGGIEVGGFIQRAMFAWQFRDVNLITTGQIRPDSRILINRDIYERVPKVAPFLLYDHDPYMAVVDGRLVWIWDAYTYSSEYPYSETMDLSMATGDRQRGAINYMRNSVKVTVDAYEGTMTFWADLDEPVTQAWSSAFPDLFTDIDEAPDSLRAHFRYPENLFQVQATHYANYHVVNPEIFYQKQDFWELPADPTTAGATDERGARLQPYYQLIRLPGEENEGFRLVVPFVPEGRVNMVAWLAASSDPGDYGKLIAYRLPQGRNIEGPQQVFGRMNQDAAFSAQRTLLSQSGSTVIFGDFIIIPIEDSFLYVLPAYVRADQATALPELRFVVVVNGSEGDVNFAPTLDEALDMAIGTEDGEPTEPGEPGEPTEPTEPTGPTGQQIQALLAEALVHFAAADEALRAGDLATYQQELAQAQELVTQAEQLALGRLPVTEPSPEPEPEAEG